MGWEPKTKKQCSSFYVDAFTNDGCVVVHRCRLAEGHAGDHQCDCEEDSWQEWNNDAPDTWGDAVVAVQLFAEANRFDLTVRHEHKCGVHADEDDPNCNAKCTCGECGAML